MTTTQKPNEFESGIDTLLASLFESRARYVAEARQALGYVASTVTTFEERRNKVTLTVEEIRERATDRRDIEFLAKYDAAVEAAQWVTKGIEPVEGVFEDRGWSRFFLVNNSNGHIHSSMNCSTCFIDTDFSWLPELSGLTEAEAVEAYGCILCSVCFPSAPVEWTNGISKADQAAKDERAAAKAEREAAKAAKAITDIDGSKLLDANGWEIKSLVTAQRELTECYFNLLLGYERNGNTNYTEAIERIAQAIAAKTGEAADDIKATHKAKAEKKYTKEMS